MQIFESSMFAPKTSKKEVQRMFAKQIAKLKSTDSDSITIDAKSWDPVRHLCGAFYDYEMKCVRPGINLEKGEELFFECRGEDDNDRWKIHAKHLSFTFTRASRVEYVDKAKKCDNDEESRDESDSSEEDHSEETPSTKPKIHYDSYKCKGCGSCATIVPIYED